MFSRALLWLSTGLALIPKLVRNDFYISTSSHFHTLSRLAKFCLPTCSKIMITFLQEGIMRLICVNQSVRIIFLF